MADVRYALFTDISRIIIQIMQTFTTNVGHAIENKGTKNCI